MLGDIPMPPSVNEKEKVIGGIFDLGQMFWIVLGVVLYAVFITCLWGPLRYFALFLGIPFPVLGFIMALKKIDDIPLPKYLRIKAKYNKTQKIYINKGIKTELEFSVYKSDAKE